MKLALTLAAGLLAVSSFAFAADSNGGKNGPDKSATASIPDTDRFDPPDETVVQSCKTAQVKDHNCRNALTR